MSDSAAPSPSHDVRRMLLERFRPEIVYDSREAFPAAAVGEMLDNPHVELRRNDGSAIARPGPGDTELNTGFFAPTGYRNGQAYHDGDHIAFPGLHDYRTQAREMEKAFPDVANVVYGHFARDSSGEHRLWLQYWYFMLFNDAQLLGRFGLHEGDWEMVQFRLVGTGPDWSEPAIDLAVYAQHTYAQSADIADLQTTPDGVPVAFSALGSHAHYFERGIFKTEGLWDVADGRGPRIRQKLVYLDEDPPGWLSWPGTWGGTLPSIPDIESSSPVGPSRHDHWGDPGLLLARVRTARPAPPAEIKTIRIRRGVRHHPQIDFDFRQIADRPAFPGSLVTTIAPVSPGQEVTSRTLVIAVDQLIGGSVTPRYALDPSIDYQVNVTWVDATGAKADPTTAVLQRLPMSGAPVIRWILYGLRWLLQRVTGRTR